jgi:DNA-binding NarL/FixJ family response regulator
MPNKPSNLLLSLLVTVGHPRPGQRHPRSALTRKAIDNPSSRLGRVKLSVRILIANERREIRQILRNFVEKDPRWEICGEAINGEDAVCKAQELVPKLIILDLGMPGLDGIEAARQIVKFLPGTMLLLCANHLTRQQREQARNAGIRGIVAKTRLGEIPEAVETLLRNETFFPRKGSARKDRTGTVQKPQAALPLTIKSGEPRASLLCSAVPSNIFFCEAVKEGTTPAGAGLLPDPDPLTCSQCARTYNLHYSSVMRPVLTHLSRLLTTDVIETEHPCHSARLSLELVPSNALN